MILYGARLLHAGLARRALALANLIRLQYPGDALKVVLFSRPRQLAGVLRLDLYYTNTRRGSPSRPPPARNRQQDMCRLS